MEEGKKDDQMMETDKQNTSNDPGKGGEKRMGMNKTIKKRRKRKLTVITPPNNYKTMSITNTKLNAT